MTGFGRADITVDGINVDVSIKSVNGRYLDVRQHLPKKYVAFESEIQKAVKKVFVRGTVDIYIQRTMKAGGGLSPIRFQTPVAALWLQEFRKVLKELKISAEVTAQDLLNHVPDFMVSDDLSQVQRKEQQALLKGVTQALEQCLKSRLQEGDFLRKTCLAAMTGLEKNRLALVKLRELFVSEAPTKMQERLKKILGEVELDPQRVLQEVGHMVDRSDIEEELQRFGEHIKNVTSILKNPEAQGKKLDFYAQELLREINTIGSKSQSAKITEIVVSTKNMIEQLREQVQNIE
jgi:uncharacterized protein (TIGR00255 family)